MAITEKLKHALAEWKRLEHGRYLYSTYKMTIIPMLYVIEKELKNLNPLFSRENQQINGHQDQQLEQRLLQLKAKKPKQPPNEYYTVKDKLIEEINAHVLTKQKLELQISRQHDSNEIKMESNDELLVDDEKESETKSNGEKLIRLQAGIAERVYRLAIYRFLTTHSDLDYLKKEMRREIKERIHWQVMAAYNVVIELLSQWNKDNKECSDGSFDEHEMELINGLNGKKKAYNLCDYLVLEMGVGEAHGSYNIEEDDLITENEEDSAASSENDERTPSRKCIIL